MKKGIFLLVIILSTFCLTACNCNNKEVKTNKKTVSEFVQGAEIKDLKVKVSNYHFNSCSDVYLNDILQTLEGEGIPHSLTFISLDGGLTAVLSIGANSSIVYALLDYRTSKDDSLNIISGYLQKEKSSAESVEEKLCSYRPKELTALEGLYSATSRTGSHNITFNKNYTCTIKNNLSSSWISKDYENCKYSLEYEGTELTNKVYNVNIDVITEGNNYDSAKGQYIKESKKMKFKLYTESSYKPISLITSDQETLGNIQAYNTNADESLVFNYGGK